MKPVHPRFRLAVLALAGSSALVLAACQRDARTVEQRGPSPAQATEIAQTPAAPPPAAAPATPPAPAPPLTSAEADRRAAELGQNPRTVILPPEPPAKPQEENLAAREKRLAARQAALDRREQRLRQREESHAAATSPEPTPAPEAAADEPAASPEAAGSPEPEPEPQPAPQPRIAVTVPAGTALDIEFSKTLSSATSQAGDTFRARVVKDIPGPGGTVAIPAGAEIVGEVTQAVPLKKIGGQAQLGLHFTDMVLPSGETVPIQASLIREGRNESKRAAATIGGAAAGGAILGNILSRGSRGTGSILGALIGAAAGTAIAAHHKGEEVEIAQGSVLGLQLDQALRVHTQP